MDKKNIINQFPTKCQSRDSFPYATRKQKRKVDKKETKKEGDKDRWNDQRNHKKAQIFEQLLAAW